MTDDRDRDESVSSDLAANDPGIPRFAWLALGVAALAASWFLVAPPTLHLAATDTGQATQDEAEEVLTGGSLFVREGCGACHATAGRSTALGPSLAGARGLAVARLGAPDYAGFADTPDSYIREATLDHCVDGASRYSYDCQALSDVGLRLSDEQVERLVDFLAALPGGGG